MKKNILAKNIALTALVGYITLALASCNSKSQDTDIFNGEIISIDEHAPEKEVEFKKIT